MWVNQKKRKIIRSYEKHFRFGIQTGYGRVAPIVKVGQGKVMKMHAGGFTEILKHNTNLINRVTAPATTGEATLVPDKERQLDLHIYKRDGKLKLWSLFCIC